jgi:Pyruvate/2-oxoacid:ferredoxin oxidoreductase delta subunit
MRRKVVKIDESKCTGCGQCVPSCAEGAIRIIDGKARLVSDVYCDGLGNCLSTCPEDAITIEEREADAFDEAAVHEHLKSDETPEPAATGCPGTQVRHAGHSETALAGGCPGSALREFRKAPRSPAPCASERPSQLSHWPVQLKLVPPNAPFLQDADLLLAADCVPFALADFHARFLTGRSVVVGCPKLDDPAYYRDKLTEILKRSSIRTLTVLHMEVPCCFGLMHIAQSALAASGKEIPLHDVTVTLDGRTRTEN